MVTFRDVDDEKRAERSAPPDRVDAALHHAGVDADVDEGEAQDHEDHDVLGVPPEHRLLAEQELMGQSEHEESQTENLYEDLKMSSFISIFSPQTLYRGPELVVSEGLELSHSWLLEDGECEDDDQGKVEDASEPPALVCGVHPDTGDGRLELHVTSRPGIVQVGGCQHYLPSSALRSG